MRWERAGAWSSLATPLRAARACVQEVPVAGGRGADAGAVPLPCLPPPQDWDQTENFPNSLGNDNLQWARKIKAVMEELSTSIAKWVGRGQGDALLD